MRWRTAAQGGVLEQFSQLGLAGDHEGDGGAGIEVEIGHAIDGRECGGGEVLSGVQGGNVGHRLTLGA